MYDTDLTSFFTFIDAILALIMIITFFVMVSKISKILSILRFFKDMELQKPENWVNFQCKKCGHNIRAFKDKSTIECPKCSTINKIP